MIFHLFSITLLIYTIFSSIFLGKEILTVLVDILLKFKLQGKISIKIQNVKIIQINLINLMIFHFFFNNFSYLYNFFQVYTQPRARTLYPRMLNNLSSYSW